MDFAIVGEVQPQQAVHKDVFVGFVRVAGLMQQRTERNILLPDASGDVFLLHAVRKPPEFSGAEDVVMHLRPPDMPLFQRD